MNRRKPENSGGSTCSSGRPAASRTEVRGPVTSTSAGATSSWAPVLSSRQDSRRSSSPSISGQARTTTALASECGDRVDDVGEACTPGGRCRSRRRSGLDAGWQAAGRRRRARGVAGDAAADHVRHGPCVADHDRALHAGARGPAAVQHFAHDVAATAVPRPTTGTSTARSRERSPAARVGDERDAGDQHDPGTEDSPGLLGAAVQIARLVGLVDRQQQHPDQREHDREADVCATSCHSPGGRRAADTPYGPPPRRRRIDRHRLAR